MSGENIKVAIRIRPLISREKNAACKPIWTIEKSRSKKGGLALKTEGVGNAQRRSSNTQIYEDFDHLYGPESTNGEIFSSLTQPIVNAALHGFNGSIFAYGMTSSGKTHTMVGTDTEPGSIPLALEHVFSQMAAATRTVYQVRVSCVEIYNETLRDLLCETAGGSKPRVLTSGTGPDATVNLVGCVEVPVLTMDAALAVMDQGNARRQVSETNMNDMSSRSHTIFRVLIESTETLDGGGSGPVRSAHLNLVDLAGSERVSQTGATNTTLKEAGSINQSLLTLAQVIRELAKQGERKASDSKDRRPPRHQHISYRSSLLTHILQPALGGNSRTAVICNISPSHDCFDQSNSTIQFASNARNVKNKARMNIAMDDDGMILKYRAQLFELNKQFVSNKEEMGRRDAQARALTDMLVAARHESLLREEQVTEAARGYDQVMDALTKYRDVYTVEQEHVETAAQALERLQRETKRAEDARVAAEEELVAVLEGWSAEREEWDNARAILDDERATLEQDRCRLDQAAEEARVRAEGELIDMLGELEMLREARESEAAGRRAAETERGALRAEIGRLEKTARRATAEAEKARGKLDTQAEMRQQMAAMRRAGEEDKKAIRQLTAKHQAAVDDVARFKGELATATTEMARLAAVLDKEAKDRLIAEKRAAMHLTDGARKEGELQEMFGQLTRTKRQMEALGQARADLQARVGELEAAEFDAAEVRQDLAAREEGWGAERARLEVEVARLQHTVDEGRVSMERVARERDAAREEVDRAEQALEKETGERRAAHDTVERLTIDIDGLNAEVARLSSTIRSRDGTVQAMEETHAALQESLEAMERRLGEGEVQAEDAARIARDTITRLEGEIVAVRDTQTRTAAEVDALQLEVDDVARELSERNAECNGLQDTVDGLEGDVRKLRSAVADADDRAANLEALVDATKDAGREATRAAEDATARVRIELTTARDTIHTLEDRADREARAADEVRRGLEARIAELDRVLDRTEAEKNRVELRVAELMTTLDRVESDALVAAEAWGVERRSITQDLTDVQRSYHSATDELARTQEELQTTDRARADAASALADLEARHATVEGARQALEGEYQALVGRLGALEAEYEGVTQRYGEATSARDELEGEHRALDGRYMGLQTRVEGLLDEISGLEGDREAARADYTALKGAHAELIDTHTRELAEAKDALASADASSRARVEALEGEIERIRAAHAGLVDGARAAGELDQQVVTLTAEVAQLTQAVNKAESEGAAAIRAAEEQNMERLARQKSQVVAACNEKMQTQMTNVVEQIKAKAQKSLEEKVRSKVGEAVTAHRSKLDEVMRQLGKTRAYATQLKARVETLEAEATRLRVENAELRG